MKSLINSAVVFVDAERTMSEVVLLMRDHNISCVLVSNHEKLVLGIITERDIVQKFTLLPQADKMLAKAGAFMTRPVHFARLNHLEQDTRELLLKQKVRHFPISVNGKQTVDDVFGIMTVTDLARNVLMGKAIAQQEIARREIVVVSQSPLQSEHYKKIFEALHYEVIHGQDIGSLFEYARQNDRPLLCDLDGMATPEAKIQLQRLKNFSGTFILLSSYDNLVEQLKPVLSDAHHHIARKPLNMSMLLKLL